MHENTTLDEAAADLRHYINVTAKDATDTWMTIIEAIQGPVVPYLAERYNIGEDAASRLIDWLVKVDGAFHVQSGGWDMWEILDVRAVDESWMAAIWRLLDLH